MVNISMPSASPAMGVYVPGSIMKGFNEAGKPKQNNQTQAQPVQQGKVVESQKDTRQAFEIVEPLIKGWEKFEPNAYWDDIGKVWTVGYGTVNRVDGRRVSKNDKMTEEEAIAEIRAKTKQIHQNLSRQYPGYNDLNPREQAALIDIDYNSGAISNSSKSPTVAKILSQRNPDRKALSREIPTYRISNGKVVRGLENRRRDTLKLFLAGEGYVPQREN